MGRLEGRLLKLEDRRRQQMAGKLPPEAVLSAPLPSEDLEYWARGLLDEFELAAPCLVIVKDAEAREVIVPRSAFDDLDWRQQCLVMGADEGPHALIWFEGPGLFVERFNDPADFARWRAKTEMDLLEDGGRADWREG